MYKKGFTLIELLVVISIIGILASVVLASLSTARQKGQVAATVSEVKQLSTAIEAMRIETGLYPNGSANACNDGNEYNLTTSHTGEYFENIPTDPWGHAYKWDGDYQCLDGSVGCPVGVDDASASRVVILSCGPTGGGAGTSCSYDRDNIVYIVCSR